MGVFHKRDTEMQGGDIAWIVQNNWQKKKLENYY